MHTYAKLKDGRTMIIWSDNLDYNGTYNMYSANTEFDPEFTTTETIKEEDILCVDSNRVVVERGLTTKTRQKHVHHKTTIKVTA